MSATTILSVFLQIGLVKNGKKLAKWGSNRVPIQSTGDISQRADSFTIPAGSGVNVFTRGDSSEQEMPGVALVVSAAGCYVDIKTDTAVGVNEQSVRIGIIPGVPFVISGWTSITALTGGTVGQIRRVFVGNLNSTASVDLQTLRIEGPE